MIQRGRALCTENEIIHEHIIIEFIRFDYGGVYLRSVIRCFPDGRRKYTFIWRIFIYTRVCIIYLLNADDVCRE